VLAATRHVGKGCDASSCEARVPFTHPDGDCALLLLGCLWKNGNVTATSEEL
jgi:hypothetical protein